MESVDQITQYYLECACNHSLFARHRIYISYDSAHKNSGKSMEEVLVFMAGNADKEMDNE